MNKKQKIQVGILVDSVNVQAWVYQSIEHILRLDDVNICCVVVDPSQPDTLPFKPMQQRLSQLLGKLFDGDINAPDYRQRKTITNFIDVPRYTLNDEVRLSAVNDYKADVLIKYTNHELANGDALSLKALNLKYGVWDHLFSADATHRAGYEGFWETMLSQPEVGSSLRASYAQLTDQHSVELLRSYSCTQEASIYGTNNGNYWKSSSFAARMLKRVMGEGDDTFFSRFDSQKDLSLESEYLAPSNVKYATLLAKKVFSKIKKKIKYKQYFEQWFLLYNLNTETSNELSSYKKLLPPKEVFWADPHVIFENYKYYIFIEELPFATDKGYLSVIEMDQNGQYTQPEKILEKDYHLSYPNVFKYKDEYYMIPETFENSTIELYRCVGFPHQWEFVMNLMEGLEAADTTLHFHENKWWLFTSIIENKGASLHDELFLFYTEGDFLTAQWTPHPLNPIVSDVKTARPAGKIYTEHGKLYRPSQNCSYHYGYGVNLNEIMVLNEKEYQEKTVVSIEPDWDKEVIATHSYSKAKDLVVMDGIILRKIKNT